MCIKEKVRGERMLRDIEEEMDLDEELEKKNKFFNYKNIAVFIVGFLLSQVEFVAGFAPFGMAILAAAMANKIPLAIPFIGVSVGILLASGLESWLVFLASAFLFIVLTIFFKGKEEEGLGTTTSKFKLFISVLIVQISTVFIGQVLVYDIVLAIVTTLATLVFYILFTYGLYVICNIKENMIFSIEEVIGASILGCLAICAFGPIEILDFNLRNVLCILVVLVLGWKNGISIGATAGVTIGCILALVGAGDITLIASYAISGLLAGVFRKFGRIGVVIGFILGNAMLAMYANGSTEVIILIKEILLASIVLLVIPKKVEHSMDELFEKTLMLKDGSDVEYSVDKQVVYRLNTVSQVFDEMADTLGESAATLVDNKEEVLQFFEDVTAKTCEGCVNSQNCWKKDLYKKYNMVFQLIDVLLEKNEITLEEFNEIIDNKCIKPEEFVQSLNGTYDLYKLNENWKKKLQENKEVISKQLKGFSDVISSIVYDINNKKEDKKEKTKFKITIGISKTAKEDNTVNGDNNIIMKLDNGKYVIGLSDGMGSGEDADKNSKLVIDMLEKFLKSGFDKQTAINLINSLLILKSEKENFATMDISVVDTKTGKVEFVKVGACPTFIKKKDRVEFVDSISLPVGIVNNIDIDLYDKELEDGDYIIMVTDGIIDSNKELHEEWIKELLEKTDIDNPQRLADVIIQESVDNSYGIAKDDMTVVVSKVRINQ